MKKLIDRLRQSLTARIFLITAVILFAACGVTYGFIAWATPISYRSIAMDSLNEQAAGLVEKLRETTLEDSGPLFDRFILETGAEVLVTDAAGGRVPLPSAVMEGSPADERGQGLEAGADSAPTAGSSGVAGAASESVVITQATSDEIITDAYTTLIQGDPFDPAIIGSVAITNSDWNLPFTFRDSDQVYELTLVANITAVNQATEAMGRVLPCLALVVLAISLLGALIYSRYITRPIVRLSGISEKMAGLDFSWTCGEKRGDEIGMLADNLNRLSQRLSAALTELRSANEALRRDIDRERELERQRSAFFAAASHELKTPVTVLKGQLSGMLAGVDVYQDRDKYLARSLAVTGRMEKLVREMLTISRMERQGFAARREPLDLSGLIQRQVELAGDLALGREQQIKADIQPGLGAAGDSVLLGRMAANLLTNGLNYSPHGAALTVRLYAGADGPVFEVENSGARIPDEALPHLFEAFYRVDASRSRETGGSGLGLYLVKMILDRHGAGCEITNTAGGVLARVRFERTL